MKSSVSARLNADLLDQQYAQWCAAPNSVDPTWAAFFEGFELGSAQVEKSGEQAPAQSATPAAAPVQASPPVPASADLRLAPQGELDFRARITGAVYHYRTLGHTQAHINPLVEEPEKNPNLRLDSFGFSEADLDSESGSAFFLHGERMKLRDLLRALEEIYCGPIGFQFMHINNTQVRYWIQERIEQRMRLPQPAREARVRALRWVMEAELFESFLGKKFLGEKRFSLEGGEGAMIVLNSILEKCPSAGILEIEMGMSHRGRLNVLANFVKKSITTILREFTPD